MKVLMVLAIVFACLIAAGWGIVFRYSSLLERMEEEERRAARRE